MIIYFTNGKVITLYTKQKESKMTSSKLLSLSFFESKKVKKYLYDKSQGIHLIKEEGTLHYTIRYKCKREE